jgi:hypothetical protein
VASGKVQINPYDVTKKQINNPENAYDTVTPTGQSGPDNSASLMGLLSQLLQRGGSTNPGSQQPQGPPQSAFQFPQPQQRPAQPASGGGYQAWLDSNYGLGGNSPAWNAMMDRSNAEYWAQQNQASPVGAAIAAGPAPYAPADTYGQNAPRSYGSVQIPSTGERWSSPGFGAGLYSLGQGAEMPVGAYTDYGPRYRWGED